MADENMTNEEALKIIQVAKAEIEWEYPMDYATAFDMANSAIEKQIPKKPILKHDTAIVHCNMGNKPHQIKHIESDNWYCPACNNGFVGERLYIHGKIHDQNKKKYCACCGQAIDWSDDDD